MNSNIMGKLIKKLREDKGWTQAELAEKIPIGRNAVSKWERGKTIPDISALIRLRDIFNVSLDELLLGEKYSQNKPSLKLKYVFASILIFSIFLGYFFVNQYKSVNLYTTSEEDKKKIAYKWLSEITNNELLKEDLYNNLKEQEEKYGSKIEAWKLLN